MGLWNLIFGEKEIKPYKPEAFVLNGRYITVHAKHGTMISIYDAPLSKIEGTVTELKQNRKEINIKNLEGVLLLSKNDNAIVEVNCHGTIQGDWYFPGKINAKTVDLSIRRPMKLEIIASVISAEGFTDVQYFYMPTDMLPEKIKKHNFVEITEEEANGSYENIILAAGSLEKTTITADVVRLSYLPETSEEEE